MAILIVYASKHGSTQGIAERIAEKLRQLGKVLQLRNSQWGDGILVFPTNVQGSTAGDKQLDVRTGHEQF